MVTGEITTRVETKLNEELLSVHALSSASLEKLQEALVRVNTFLAEPASLLIQIVPNFASQGRDANQNAEYELRSRLLERKRLILQRIEEKSNSEVRETLSQVAQTSPAFVKELSGLQKKVEGLGDYKKQLEFTNQSLIELALQKNKTESRHALFTKFLERGSIASLVGALLLLINTFAFIYFAAGKDNKDAYKTLGSVFLIIVGYFFGQASRTGKKK